MTLIPRVSEKTYAVAQSGHTYVFNVPATATKQQIAALVASEHNVKVADVRVVNVKGKPVRASRGKRANPGTALRTKRKKAYVRLSEGTINVFNEEEAK